MPHEITNLNRSICGVDLYVGTTDPDKVAKIKAALDRAMRKPKQTSQFGTDFIAALREMKARDR